MAKVLVVDDEKSIRTTLSEFLKEAGHEVHTAEDADAATALMRSQVFDVVVCDIILPRVTGVALLETIREACPHVEVIMVTGEPTVETAAAALRAGAFDYLFKPVAKDAILKSVANAVRLKAAEDEKRRLEEENRGYREHLEQLVEERTRALRQSEECFHQAQKMEAIGQLAGGVAHDFNNLLTGMMGYTEFALSKLDKDSPMHKDLVEVLGCGTRAADLTRQLLAFSRKQTLQPVVLAPNTLIANLTKMLNRLIGEDIKLSFQPAAELDTVNADPVQIEQVLMNLVVNARDVMPRGGVITIDTSNVTIDQAFVEQHPGTRPGRHVQIAVSDTGCGMDEVTQRRIFEPFFTTKGRGKGTGLGLSTVYGIVKQHDGHISVHSMVGQGTTFRVYLPAVCGKPASAEMREVPAVGGAESLLLVEDEATVRTVAERTLQSQGYTVFSASLPSEAEEMLENEGRGATLLLTDVIMPESDGRELYERLRARRPGLKVLYMSGYTDSIIARRGVLEPGAPFLEKPFTADRLARKVREVLDAAETTHLTEQQQLSMS